MVPEEGLAGTASPMYPLDNVEPWVGYGWEARRGNLRTCANAAADKRCAERHGRMDWMPRHRGHVASKRMPDDKERVNTDVCSLRLEASGSLPEPQQTASP